LQKIDEHIPLEGSADLLPTSGKNGTEEGPEGVGLVGEESIPDLFGVILLKDVRGPDPGAVSNGAEADESPPDFIPSEEVQAGPPLGIPEPHGP
jgi:hypothetical protein